jgi:hypothetical protein
VTLNRTMYDDGRLTLGKANEVILFEMDWMWKLFIPRVCTRLVWNVVLQRWHICCEIGISSPSEDIWLWFLSMVTKSILNEKFGDMFNQIF